MKKTVLFSSLVVLMFCLTFIENAQGFAIQVEMYKITKEHLTEADEFPTSDSYDDDGVKVDEDLSSLLSGPSSSASLTSSLALVVVPYFSSKYFSSSSSSSSGAETGEEEKGFIAESPSDATSKTQQYTDENDEETVSVSRPTLHPLLTQHQFIESLFLRNITSTTPLTTIGDGIHQQAQQKEKEREEQEGEITVVVQVETIYTLANNHKKNENGRENSLVDLSKESQADLTDMTSSIGKMIQEVQAFFHNATDEEGNQTSDNSDIIDTTEFGDFNGTTEWSVMNISATVESLGTTEWSVMDTSTTEESFGTNETSRLSTIKILRKMFDPRKMDVMYFFGGVASMLAVVGALLLTRKLLYRPVNN